jgi:pSer/pThr/pTyr-binding forkhead associated (FHA) protein
LVEAKENDLVIDTTSASRYHALITVVNDEYLIEDLNSANGVQVNGEEVRGTRRLFAASSSTVGAGNFSPVPAKR